MLVTFLLLLALLACQEPSPWTGPPDDDPDTTCDGFGSACVERCCETGYSCQRGQCVDASSDRDLDGHPAYRDCDDYDEDVFPGAQELCDDVDNNCDQEVDEGVRDPEGDCAECHDLDGDGHDDCGGDCDDDDASAFPTAPEECDDVDNDCDGEVDEGFDLDGDGAAACGAMADCDDSDPFVAPGFLEACDSVDNDCDGTVDDGQLCGATGECLEGACTWTFEPAGDEAWHRCGSATTAGSWCSNGCAAGEVLIGAPEGGIDELPLGAYNAYFRAKVNEFPTAAECERPRVLRLRVVDLDDPGDAGCQDCFERCADCTTVCEECTFGGATNIAASTTYFEAPGTFADLAVPFVVDEPRAGHRLQAVAVYWTCTVVRACVARVRIVAQ